MPTITGTATWNASVTVPITDDVITAAAFTESAQQLANQATSNYDHVMSTGVRAIRTAADLTALAAISDQIDGQCALVPQIGIYTYVAGASTAADSWRVVVPGGGGGRWYHSSRSLLGVASGLVQLDSNAKVPKTSLAYQTFLVGAISSAGANTNIPSNGAITALTGGSVTLTGTLVVGDLVEIDGMAYAIPASSAPASLNVYARAGSSNTYGPKSPIAWPAAITALGVTVPVVSRYTVIAGDVSNGYVTVALVADAATNAATVNAVALRCSVIRP